MSNIWSSVEAAAWAKDFNYDEYVDLAKKMAKHEPVSLEVYHRICMALQAQMGTEFSLQPTRDL